MDLPESEHFRPKTHQELLSILEYDGSWVKNYKSAEGRQKQALELLFRCSIIPTEEFAHSRVSQDHMDECVWIATHMLKQKPLEEWVNLCPEACQAFQASVTACFSARTDVRAITTQLDRPPRSSSLDHSTPSPGDHLGPSAASTLLDLSKLPPPDQPDILNSVNANGENLLVLRCREIMASHGAPSQDMQAACAAAVSPRNAGSGADSALGPGDSVSQPPSSRPPASPEPLSPAKAQLPGLPLKEWASSASPAAPPSPVPTIETVPTICRDDTIPTVDTMPFAPAPTPAASIDLRMNEAMVLQARLKREQQARAKQEAIAEDAP